MKSHQGEVIISNELLYELRVGKGLSQEEVSEDICAQETLSRIERKKRTPNRKKLNLLLEKLDYDRELLQGDVVTDDYQVLEMIGKINEYRYKKETDKSYEMLEPLEQKLDMTDMTNRQYIEHEHLLRKIESGQIDVRQTLEELEKLLGYTMRDFHHGIYRKPTRLEFIIINHMAIRLKKSGRMQEAEKLYRQVRDCYRNSEVAARDHATSQFLLYINYVGILEIENKLAEAEKLGWEGIRLMLECQRGDVAGTLLMNIACIYEKMPGEENLQMAKACMRTSYHLLKMYRHEKDAERIKQYYEKK